MKRVFVGLLAVGGLVASALVAVVVAVAPASAQVERAAITVAHSGSAFSGTLPGDPENQIRVSISPVSDCDPGGGGPASPAILGAGDSFPSLLSTSCNWEFSFFHIGTVSKQCAVSASFQDSNGDAVGFSDSSGSVELFGIGGDNQLRRSGSGVGVATINLEPLLNNNSACNTPIEPVVDITVPQVESGGRNIYVGTEFTVEFTSDMPNCSTSGPATYVVGADGTVVLAVGETAPMTVHLPAVAVVDLSFDGGLAVADFRCEYSVSLPESVGALSLQSSPVPTTKVNGGTGIIPELVPVSATYAPATVGVGVVAVFPEGLVFPTSEKVSYRVEVVSPCGGGFVRAYPSEIANDGEFAEVQAFGGRVHVFGSVLDSILRLPQPLPRSFVTPAFADVRGEVPCGVRVSELGAPAGCVTADGVQSQAYTEGVDELLFEFVYSCGGDGGEGGGDSSTTPPVPVAGPLLESPAG